MTQLEMLEALCADGWLRCHIAKRAGIAVYKLDDLFHYNKELNERNAIALQKLYDLNTKGNL